MRIMKRKWREIEEMDRERGNGERFTLYIFSVVPPSLSISYINNCLILLQNVEYSTFVANVKHMRYEKIILGRIRYEKTPQVVRA